MHSVRKGNQWFFGMRVHAEADAASGLTHGLSVTAANASEITQAEALLHGEENAVHADAGYTGIEKRSEHQNRKVGWFIAEKRGRIRAMAKSIEKEIYQEWERRKAQVRAKVEHLFHYRKVRYRGLAKNRAQIYSLFALANLVIAKRARRPA